MDYVAFFSGRPSVAAEQRDAALARRAKWQYPEGATMIAEYWPMSAEYQAVAIFSADTFAPVLEIQFEWNDVFDVAIYPAVSAEEGIRIGPEVFGRLARMRKS
jgi:hypothetical protein